MNILLINPGRRDYIIKYFLKLKKKYNLKIFLIDCDKYIPSFKVSKDTHNFISPKNKDKKLYKSFLRKFIKKYKIKIIFPVSDRELQILAEEKKFYEKNRVNVIISNLKFINFTQNKKQMSKILNKNGFYSPEIIKYYEISRKLPVIKKKISGSGSVFQSVIKKNWQIPKLDEKSYFYSKYLNYEEYGIDILNDLNGNYVHSCCRKKILMRSGDTDKAKIVNVKVFRPKVHETTALGAAFMAGLKIGCYKSLKDISKNWSLEKKFSPKMKNKSRKILINGWSKAIKRALIN